MVDVDMPRKPVGLRVAGADFVVRGLRGVEELSRPFRFDVSCAGGGPSPEELLGAAATLTLVGPRGVLRVVRGIAARVRTGGGRGAAVEVRVVPRLWVLGRGRRSRVFQDKSVPDIVQQVLGERAIDCAVSTSRAYAPRPYCVQYQESDLTFVSRIAAEEGLFYYFRQPSAGSDAKEVVVFGDAPAHFESIAGERKLPMQHGGALSTSEHVSTLVSSEALRSGKSLVRAYDQEKPLYDLRGEGASPSRGALDETALLTYRHDADALEGVDDGVAGRLVDALRRRASTAAGSSTCVALSAGLTFEVEGHAVEALNAGYTLVRVEHEGNQPVEAGDAAVGPSYANHFECVSATARWRPKKPLRKLQQTTETAVVVGPPGEEIYVDAEGRVKVQFPWDLEGKHDEASSCWLRTMQPWAGASWGTQFIPRVGMEVVVLFVAGDVDRPLIAGSVANGVNPMPFALPAHKTQSGIRTRSSPGGDGSNELRFEDAAGAEQIYLHAQKDLDVLVEHDHSRKVGHGEAIRVADDRLVDVGGSQKRTVAKGDELHVGNTRAMEIGGDHVRVVNGNEIVEIGKNLVVNVTGKYVLQVDGQDDQARAPAPEATPPEAPDETAPELPAVGPSHVEVAAAAELVWAVEQLPEELFERGVAKRAAAAELMAHVTALANEVEGLTRLFAASPDRLAPSVANGARGILSRAALFRDALRDAQPAATSPGLEEVDGAFSKFASGCTERIAASEGKARQALAAAEARSADGALGSGSLSGGAGAAPTWQDKSADLGGDQYNSAAVLDITGAGVIDGSSLTFSVGDSTSVYVTPDSVVFYSPKVNIKDGLIHIEGGKRVLVHAPDVKVGDGDIVISGTDISVGATSSAIVKGAVITMDPP